MSNTTTFSSSIPVNCVPQMKTRSKEPRPPGIILTIPAHAATMKIAKNAQKGTDISNIEDNSQIERKAAVHSSTEANRRKSRFFNVTNGDVSFLFFFKVPKNKIGRYNPTPITAK